jgi:Sulfotransferase domain
VLSLRPMTEDDLPAVATWMRLPHVARWWLPGTTAEQEIARYRRRVMQAAINDAGGDPPIVIDSDDLVTRPAATMAAYCAAVGLPFNSRALTWEPGEQAEWQRSAIWHTDASSSSGFERRERPYLHTVENCEKLARYAAHHRPFYDRLYAQRVNVAPWE